MNNLPYKTAWLAGVALVAGCQSVPRAADYSMVEPTGTYAPSPAEASYQAQSQMHMAQAAQMPDAAYQDIEPAAGRAPRPMAPQAYAAPQAYVPQADSASMAELSKLRDRVERVERAMLRLDRRMQLVEKNELNRMDGPASSKISQNDDGTEAAVMQAAEVDPSAIPGSAPAYGGGFQAVSAQSVITSGLQAAPRAGTAEAPRMVASVGRTGLPSLADPAPVPTQKAEEAVSIWTVRFDDNKVWPDRAQLPASRDIVEALRSGTGTLYARGNQPNSVVFRDRVKALSRYLAKVSSKEAVPIAAMNAPHLDENTIEVFAAH